MANAIYLSSVLLSDMGTAPGHSGSSSTGRLVTTLLNRFDKWIFYYHGTLVTLFIEKWNYRKLIINCIYWYFRFVSYYTRGNFFKNIFRKLVQFCNCLSIKIVWKCLFLYCWFCACLLACGEAEVNWSGRSLLSVPWIKINSYSWVWSFLRFCIIDKGYRSFCIFVKLPLKLT